MRLFLFFFWKLSPFFFFESLPKSFRGAPTPSYALAKGLEMTRKLSDETFPPKLSKGLAPKVSGGGFQKNRTAKPFAPETFGGGIRRGGPLWKPRVKTFPSLSPPKGPGPRKFCLPSRLSKESRADTALGSPFFKKKRKPMSFAWLRFQRESA